MIQEGESAGNQFGDGDPDFRELGYQDGLKSGGNVFFPPRNPHHPDFEGSVDAFKEYIGGFTDGWVEARAKRKKDEAESNGD